MLRSMLTRANLPHMLFYGPPGTGKTSTILAMAKQLFGPELMRSRVLELNASDERGIDIVRVKVKDFARVQLSVAPSKAYTDTYPCPPFKIIVLDEADSMTTDAQSALRRTIENYARITRFCLICNYVTRIIDPIASRCAKFRFKRLDGDVSRSRLEQIAALEAVDLAAGASDALIRCSDGDLRRAITLLQSAARLAGAGQARGSGGGADADADADAGDAMVVDRTDSAVTVRSIEEIAGVVPDDVLNRLLDALLPAASGKMQHALIFATITDLTADGWSAAQLVSQLHRAVIYDERIPDRAKYDIFLDFSEIDKRLADGADEQLTLLDLSMRISGRIVDHASPTD